MFPQVGAELYGHLPVELLSTGSRFYAFDAGRVEFLEVDETLFDVLAELRSQPRTVDELVLSLPQHDASSVADAYAMIGDPQEAGLLKPYSFQRAKRHQNDDYRAMLSRRMRGMTIFITTQCNLGCSYCIYGGQYEQHEKLSQRPMDWDTLKAAMDFLLAHSIDSDSVRVDFFGGEPMMAFELIERGVNYLRDHAVNPLRQVEVTITSNGTIMNKAMIDFLVRNDVFIQFSIDGGEKLHDRNRLFKGSNRPSFMRILDNLAAIDAIDPVYYDEKVRIKSVITDETLDTDDSEFFAHPMIRRVIDNGHYSFLPLEPHYDLARDKVFFHTLDKLAAVLKRGQDAATEGDLVAPLTPQQRDLYRRTLAAFFDVQAIDQALFKGQEAVPFAKGCMTGYKEGAVNADGDISVCLKSAKGDAYVIGNVIEGEWYFDRIESLNSWFHESWTDCKSCFVQRFCDLCYEKMPGDSTDLKGGRRKFCDFNRAKHRAMFSHMLEVTENNDSLRQNMTQIVADKVAQRIGRPTRSRKAVQASRKTANIFQEGDQQWRKMLVSPSRRGS